MIDGDSIGLARPPLVDTDLMRMEAELERARTARRSADTPGCLRLGERHFIAGRFDDAARCADRVLAVEPYVERAHRLAIACHVHRNDEAALAMALDRARSALAEIGVEPDLASQMLFRQAETRRHAGRSPVPVTSISP